MPLWAEIVLGVLAVLGVSVLVDALTGFRLRITELLCSIAESVADVFLFWY